MTIVYLNTDIRPRTQVGDADNCRLHLSDAIVSRSVPPHWIKVQVKKMFESVCGVSLRRVWSVLSGFFSSRYMVYRCMFPNVIACLV